MTFPSEDDLVLHYYGESGRAAEIEALLAESPALAARYEELCRVLDAVDEALPAPERDAAYGARVWRRLTAAAPGLLAGRARIPWRDRIRAWWSSPGPPRPAWAGLARAAAAAALLLVAGFFLGRLQPRMDEPPAAAGLAAETRDQILLAALSDHLERSERLLVEVANAEPDEPEEPADLAAERRWAEDLLAANRLYRQSARRGGRPRLAAVLDELEPLLLELAHAPDALPADDLAVLRERIEERALLFKMRIVADRLERLGGVGAAPRRTATAATAPSTL